MSSEFAVTVDPSAERLAHTSDPTDFFASNLTHLLSPALAEQVRQCANVRARHTPSRSGADGLELAGRALCSTIDPQREARLWALAQDIDQVEIIVLYGLGNAYHLEALRERCDKPIAILEPSREVIRAALSHRLLPHSGIRVFDAPAALSAWLSRRVGPQQLVGVVSWPPTRRLFPNLGELTCAAVSEAVRLARLNIDTLNVRLRVWVEHLLRNLPCSVGRVPAPGLGEWLDGRPVIVVAAGPSLAKNVHHLRAVAGRAAVIAVNTSLRALERAGVRADLVVAVEALDVSSQLEGLELNRDCPRALGMTASPALHRISSAPVFPFLEALSHFEALGDSAGLMPAVPLGGSVANAAFSLACLLGARQIVLVGQDLAYSDGRAYAPGTLFEEVSVSLEGQTATLSNLACKRQIAATRPEIDTTRVAEQVRWIPGWSGDRVCTTAAFDYFRTVFEDWAEQLRGIDLVNATEGGRASLGSTSAPWPMSWPRCRPHGRAPGPRSQPSGAIACSGRSNKSERWPSARWPRPRRWLRGRKQRGRSGSERRLGQAACYMHAAGPRYCA
jgi:hypothetical protein